VIYRRRRLPLFTIVYMCVCVCMIFCSFSYQAIAGVLRGDDGGSKKQSSRARFECARCVILPPRDFSPCISLPRSRGSFDKWQKIRYNLTCRAMWIFGRDHNIMKRARVQSKKIHTHAHIYIGICGICGIPNTYQFINVCERLYVRILWSTKRGVLRVACRNCT